MEKKDYFSSHARLYASFRPHYPDELFDFLLANVRDRSCAWDCGTGNGQVAGALSEHFRNVYATDISREQLEQACQAPNINYLVSPAEESPFEDRTFDLITVAQALHWFEHRGFFREAARTGKPGSLLAVWGYSLPTVMPAIDDLLLDLYQDTVGAYWDSARRHVENHYRDIPLPFEPVLAPELTIRLQWNADQLSGYVSSWSATQNYMRATGDDPIKGFRKQLEKVWPVQEIMEVSFPIFLKVSRLPS